MRLREITLSLSAESDSMGSAIRAILYPGLRAHIESPPPKKVCDRRRVA